MPEIITSLIESPAGLIEVGSVGAELCLCTWAEGPARYRNIRHLLRYTDGTVRAGTCGVNDRAMAQLEEYFAGSRTEFDVPLRLYGTPFQTAVWAILRQIPYGTCISYAEEAVRLGRPEAVRAVARANGANALSIFIPCHRVIASGGVIGGYAGGISTKRRLLELESSRLSIPDLQAASMNLMRHGVSVRKNG